MNTIKYKFIDHKSNKLILAINDMGAALYDEDVFSPYMTFIKMFPDYNILFVKETQLQYWYLEHIESIKDEINQYAANYNEVYLLTASSGGFLSFHIMPHIINLKNAILINMQTYLNKEHLDQYDDIIHMDDEKTAKYAHLFYPLNVFPPTCNVKIRYYTGYFGSDKDYCEHLETLCMPQIEIIKEPGILRHVEYIQKKFKLADNNTFYDEARSFFSNN